MVIETKRLLLREMTDDDFYALYKVLADSDIMQHYPYAFDENRVRNWIERNIERYRVFGFGLWAVCLKKTGEMIGDCGLTMQLINGEIKPEIGYHIRADKQRKGYAKEAAIAVRDWTFNNTPFNIVYSYMKYTNETSAKTAMSYGCKQVDEFSDEINEITKVFAISKDEWINRQIPICKGDNMNRPYIICHMVTSLDGKVTGDFLFGPECEGATEIYYDINRNLKSNGFICGRVTMEGSFTGGYYPDLSDYEPVHHDLDLKMDFILDDMTGFYAVAFDPKGKLGWKSNKIIDPDGDPGYDGAQIIEVLTEQVDERYLGYLESMEIPYIFAGETEIDVDFALFKLKNIIGCETLLLEGGSIINGSFERADAIDELSIVVAPIVANKDDKPLFMDSTILAFELTKSETINGNLVLNYKRKR